jgi:PAS domain S-box-containing protein
MEGALSEFRVAEPGALSPAGEVRRSLSRIVASVVAVSLGYFALALVGTVLKVPPSGFSIVWPGSAFLTGALLLTPVRAWWTYLPGFVLAHLLITALAAPDTSVVNLTTQLLANAALAAGTAAAVRRLSEGKPSLDSFRGALVFILIGGVAVPGVVDLLILSFWATRGPLHEPLLSLRQWMMATCFPTITIVPLMMGAADLAGVRRRGRRAEVALLSAALFAVTYLAFGKDIDQEFEPTLLLTPLPIVLWAAARWGVGGASLSLLVAAGAIILRALGGTGPFAAGASPAGMLSLQVYLLAIAAPVVLLAALMEELRRGEDQLRRSEARMEIAAAATDTGLWQWDAAGSLWTTDHCLKMFGLARAAHTPDAFLDAVHPDDRPRVGAALEEALAGRDVRALSEFRVSNADGERWFIMRTRSEKDAEGRAVRVSGVFRDITQSYVAQQQSDELAQRLLTLQEDERKSIAAELHDSTAQHLVAVKLLVDMVERRTDSSDRTRGLLQHMRSTLAEAINELRSFTYLLRPVELDRQGLSTVLRKYARGFAQRTGLEVATRLGPDADDLPIEQQRALLRIVQESLANVFRHAQATRVRVELRRYRDEVHLIVCDNGHGFSGTSNGEPVRFGVGIPGMGARVRQLGGKFDVRSGSRGATVHVALTIVAGRERPEMLFGAPEQARRAGISRAH